MGESDRPPRRATILIVGDDDVSATNLQIALTGAGYLVRQTETAVGALAALESSSADVILMSLMLPDTDGLILCSTLKARFPAASIIVVSSRPSEVDHPLALESGALDLLTTPVNMDALLHQVNSIVHPPVSARRASS